MSLRAKIFSLVGGLFFIAFIAAQFLEEYVTSKNLHLQTQELNRQIVENQESKRQELQRFARFLIDDATNEIAVLLGKIREYDWLKTRFSPSAKNMQDGTWFSSCDLVDRNKWIDFIENTADGKIQSLVMLDNQTLGMTTKVSYEEMGIEKGHEPPFALFMGKQTITDEKWQGPYIGIPEKLDVVNIHAKGTTSSIVRFYFLFKPESMMSLDVNRMQAILNALKTGHYPINIEISVETRLLDVIAEMIESVKTVQNYLKANPSFYEQLQKGKIAGLTPSTLNHHCQNFISDVGEINPIKASDFRYGKLSMLWQMSMILTTKLFGIAPFDPTFPVGVTEIPPEFLCGQSLMCERVFYDIAKLTAREYTPIKTIYGQEKPYQKILLQDEYHRVFFAGAIDLIEGNTSGTLMVGVDAEDLIKELSLASASQTFFVSEGRILKGFSSIGTELLAEELVLPLDKIRDLNSGFFTQNGTEFFFMRLIPYPGFDLSFYLVVPKILAFSISISLKENARELIRVISVQMQFISLAALVLVLFSLNHIAKHVTEPISHLARACKILRDGRLHEVHLPKLGRKVKDEIYLLYHSFDEMILGLKEKEKVQGVLNKVVSPSIAEEILKGKIHLGGEEKEVTVLFADIRHFTKISEIMPPHDLIYMLNTCMTKVSHAIDAAGGVIDKYVGDEVMALFGAPIATQDAPYKAVKCAFDILSTLQDWNYLRQKDNLPLIEMGIGIHTGLVVAGNMGAENRLNYTVLGSNVNLASRLCSIAKPGQILMSQATLSSPHVKENFEVQSLDKILLKGFKEPIEVFAAIKNVSANS